MITNAAHRSRPADLEHMIGIASRADLSYLGITDKHVAAQLKALRWRILGRAIVLHNGPLTRQQTWEVARLNCGPRAVLAAFTAAEALGLKGWTRDAVHILAPGGTRRPRLPDIEVRLHLVGTWPDEQILAGRPIQRLAPALIWAASTFAKPRPACGLLAAGVQQRLVRPGDLRDALNSAIRTRHRALLLHAAKDIEQGAHALGEIDFARLCRRYQLPTPEQQTIRRDRSGRRRYLDASWRRGDGRLVAVEVDGAIHLAPTQWWDDQLRQNGLALAGALVLRYPSVVVRTEPELIARQLAAALFS
jgi:hypothetical protein